MLFQFLYHVTLAQEKLKEYFPNGKLKSEGKVLNKLKAGVWTFYYDNGYIQSSGNYLRDSMNGKWEFYYDNGQLMGKANYKMSSGLNKGKSGIPLDGRDGYFISYYPNGKIWQEQKWLHGEYNGAFISHREDGSFDFTGFYAQGLKDSSWTYYYDSGIKKLEESYYQNKLHGVSRSFNKKGKLEKELHYKSGEPDGYYAEYYNDGVTKKKEGNYSTAIIESTTGVYRDGKVETKKTYGNKSKAEGVWKEWYSNGNLKSQGEYRNGMKFGLWTTWYINGNKQTEGKYRDDSEDGLWTGWYSNGELKGIGNYYNSDRVGKWLMCDMDCGWVEEEFDRSGKPINISEAFYPDGKKKFVKIYDAKLTKSSFPSDEYLLSAWDKYGNQTLKKGKGYMIEYFDFANGKVYKNTNYQNGILDGFTCEYFKNGFIYSVDFNNPHSAIGGTEYPRFGWRLRDKDFSNEKSRNEYLKLITKNFNEIKWERQQDDFFSSIISNDTSINFSKGDTLFYNFIYWQPDGHCLESSLHNRPEKIVVSTYKDDLFIKALQLIKPGQEILFKFPNELLNKSSFLPHLTDVDGIIVYLTLVNKKSDD